MISAVRILSVSILLSCCSTVLNADNVLPSDDSHEALLGSLESSAFEELYEFTDASKYKKAGSSVGYLSVEFQNRRNGVVIRGSCTATLLESSMILTARHCLTDDDDPTNPVFKVWLWMAYDTQLEQASPYEVDATALEQDLTLDYAILKVNGDPVSMFGVASLAQKNPPKGEELFIVHHPQAKRKQLTRRLCRVRQIDQPYLRYNCHTLKGSSGAPLFSDNDGSMRMIGMHTGPKVLMNQTLNQGTLITDIEKKSCIVQQLLKGLSAEVCATGGAVAKVEGSVQGTQP